MLNKDQLRKTDVFSSAVIFLFGLWVVSQALRMPMKDSWGGVMNVWYVSPALMPLFVGAMIMLLGAMLCVRALKDIGSTQFAEAARWLFSGECVRLLTSDATSRFYAIAVIFLTLVYVNLSRVDFFVSAFLFLFPFITMFYFFDDALSRRLLLFYLAGEVGLIVFFSTGLSAAASAMLPHASDVLALCFTFAYYVYARCLIRRNAVYTKRLRVALLVSVLTPLVMVPIFKYFLKVPMPKEGLLVSLMDTIWYLDF